MKRLSRNIDIKNSKNVYAIAVAIALILASALLVTYYVALRPAPDRYVNVYYLSSDKTTDYPEFAVANVNSTFSLYVTVENHLGYALTDAQLQVKVTGDSNPSFPLNANATQVFNGTVQDGASWTNLATVSLNAPGQYFVVFELWTSDGNGLQFSGYYATLSVVVAAS
jgi:uncharacterized membrane protein